MIQVLSTQRLPKLSGKEIAEALDMDIRSTTRAIRDMLRGLVRDWMANPDQTLMTILLFRDHGDAMYPPTLTPAEIPPQVYRYLKAGKLARLNLTAFFGILLAEVAQARLLQTR